MLKGTSNKLKIVGVAVIVLIVLIVVLQNTQSVETKLLFLTVTAAGPDHLLKMFADCTARPCGGACFPHSARYNQLLGEGQRARRLLCPKVNLK